MDMTRHPRRLRVAPQRIKPEIHQIELVSELDLIDNLYVLSLYCSSSTSYAGRKKVSKLLKVWLLQGDVALTQGISRLSETLPVELIL